MRILLSKLESYGFRGVAYNLLKSYLTNRSQQVRINDVLSDVRFLTHGVPQGSILGPLLFFIFINDLPNSSSLFKFVMYADDSTLSTPIPGNLHENEINEFIKFINTELSLVNTWLKSNKIQLNSEKTKYMFFFFQETSHSATY